MIYTVTFNPAIDYIMCADKIIAGAVNRSGSEEIYYGGKGINVSAVLSELGIQSTAFGFIAGFTGVAIERGVSEMGIKTDFVRLKDGLSRINVKIKADTVTEINGCGPKIDGRALEDLFEKFNKVKAGDTIILSGSVPTGAPKTVYAQILERFSGADIKSIVDASGELLTNTLKYRPYLIKPNTGELGEIFGLTLTNNIEIEHYARKLQAMGAKNVLVSMAENGAMLVDENGKTHQCPAYRGTVKNSVGAGDSMVAGFAAGMASGDYDYALRLASACGGATAFSDGLAKRDKIFELLKQV